MDQGLRLLGLWLGNLLLGEFFIEFFDSGAKFFLWFCLSAILIFLLRLHCIEMRKFRRTSVLGTGILIRALVTIFEDSARRRLGAALDQLLT